MALKCTYIPSESKIILDCRPRLCSRIHCSEYCKFKRVFVLKGIKNTHDKHSFRDDYEWVPPLHAYNDIVVDAVCVFE